MLITHCSLPSLSVLENVKYFQKFIWDRKYTIEIELYVRTILNERRGILIDV